MKKIFLLLFVITSTVSLSAQGFYIRAGGGYGLAAATNQIGEKYLHTQVNTVDITSDNYSKKIVTGSYGAGMNLTLAAGYEFNQNFIFDLDIYYLGGRNYKTNNIYNYTADNYNGTSTDLFTTSSAGLFVNPSFIFSAGFGKAAPYGRFGLVAGSPQVTQKESYYNNLDGTVTRDITWVYKNGLAIGYQAGIGMNWKLTDKLDIYTEANFTGLTFYAKEGDMTRNVYDGNDYLSQYTVAQKKILYLKNYDPQTPYDAAKPLLAARTGSPFSSFSVQAGIRFKILKIKD
jgi:hypothetical protein